MISRTPGLYIHIPFCKSRCAYCDFYSTTQDTVIPEYLSALQQEMRFYRDEFSTFDTIYLGGGTPSLLNPQQVAGLFQSIHQTFTIAPDAEITMEANPADLTLQDLKNLHDLGINRINFGVQSFNDKELGFLGRRHDSNQAIRSIEDAHTAGFTNIGLDLIYCLPGQNLQTWMTSLKQATELSPNHLSCYELELKNNSPLGQMLIRGEIKQPDEDTQREFFMQTSEALQAAGFIHYEVSNFARGIQHASRHNQKYWDHTPYLGLGPSAHSFKENRRWWNHASLHDYLARLEHEHRPVAGHESLNDEQLLSEILFLGFRTRKGIDLQYIHQRFGRDILREHAQTLQRLSQEGFIIIESHTIRPTLTGMAVADSLALL